MYDQKAQVYLFSKRLLPIPWIKNTHDFGSGKGTEKSSFGISTTGSSFILMPGEPGVSTA